MKKKLLQFLSPFIRLLVKGWRHAPGFAAPALPFCFEEALTRGAV